MAIQIDGMMIFNALISVAVFFIGLWFKRLDKDLTELKEELKTVKATYQTKELAQVQSAHSDKILTEIRIELTKLNEKMDKKADK